MIFLQRIARAAALGTVILLGPSLSAPPAQAGYTVTLMQQGSNVIASGNGSIDLTDLSADGIGFTNAGIFPAFPMGSIVVGPASSTAATFYTGSMGPLSFGSGGQTAARSGDGDLVGILVSTDVFGGLDTDLVVPQGYVSGNPYQTPRSMTARPLSASALYLAPMCGDGAPGRTPTASPSISQPLRYPSRQGSHSSGLASPGSR
jgi:hypothetical protein